MSTAREGRRFSVWRPRFMVLVLPGEADTLSTADKAQKCLRGLRTPATTSPADGSSA